MGGKGNNTLPEKILDPGGFVWDQSPGLPGQPDWNAAVEKQAQSSRPNQYTPFGSSQWTQDPKTGQWTQSVTMADGLQQGVNSLENQIGSQGPIGGQQARTDATNAVYNEYASRLDPQWQQAQEQTQNQLANQGLAPGSEAYDKAMGNLNRAQNDAYSQARQQAVTQGLQAEQTDIGAQMAPYQALGMTAAYGSPQSYAQGQPAMYLPAAMAQYQGAMTGYSAQQAGKNSKMSGAASAAPMIAAML